LSILNDAYLKEQLITYIGNKRRLLPLIQEALWNPSRENSIFLDLFSGSGVVSRLARLMGYNVIANDWEEYSRVLGESHLKLNRSDIVRLFGSSRTLKNLLNDLNTLPQPDESDCYMSRYYAPSDSDIHKADYRKERLFYTRENALRIDAIRNYIEKNFPEGSGTDTMAIRSLLIGLLLCESSKHTNTSGVFKAYHKGFGGHGQDALSRITGRIELSYPVLPSEYCKGAQIFCRDANELVMDKTLPSADTAYLDPPYNQHQYGSNYHILNTIARWDKIPAPLELNEKGVLKEKAAIRRDWVRTKSPYCYKRTADLAFSELMEHLDARRILISYSNEGLIPFEKMMEICEKRGNISIISNEYTKFRGGRQSNSRLHSNIEFIMVVDTEKKKSSYSKNRIRRMILFREIALLQKKVYSRQRLFELGSRKDQEQVIFEIKGKEAVFRIKWAVFIQCESDLSSWSKGNLEKLYQLLVKCACGTRSEELNEIFNCILEEPENSPERLMKEIPRRIKMIAHKKTKDEYFLMLEKYEKLRLLSETNCIDKQIIQIKIQAEKRLRE